MKEKKLAIFSDTDDKQQHEKLAMKKKKHPINYTDLKVISIENSFNSAL
jgi:hypothetical protein